jgi:phosphotransferase system enzyme I (PtsI)
MMYPMVSCVEELKEAAAVLDEVKKELESERIPYKKDIPVGAMIEVPSAALLADSLAKYVDFFSIGTNDLIQYVMAADRGNDAVSHLYQPTNPAIIKLMRLIVDAAKRNSIKVGVCGESASDPIVGVLWAAFGIDMLSMSATYIPVMAKLLAELTRDDLKEYMHLAESLSTELSGKEIYDLLYAWMKKKIPRLDEILI